MPLHLPLPLKMPQTGWKVIPGTNGLSEAHPDGLFRHTAGTYAPNRQGRRVRLYTIFKNKGFWVVNLRVHRGAGQPKLRSPAQTLLETFVGPAPIGVCFNSGKPVKWVPGYRDGNSDNLRVSNLYWLPPGKKLRKKLYSKTVDNPKIGQAVRMYLVGYPLWIIKNRTGLSGTMADYFTQQYLKIALPDLPHATGPGPSYRYGVSRVWRQALSIFPNKYPKKTPK